MELRFNSSHLTIETNILSQKVLRHFVNESALDDYDTVLSTENAGIIWTAYIGSFQLIAVLGAQLARILADRIGRKRTLFCGATFALAGSVTGVDLYKRSYYALL